MNAKIAKQIQAEQDHGRQKYGKGPKDYAHDDAHTMDEWQIFLTTHTRRMSFETPQEQRQRLVKIAGLAVSAIESFDRKK